MNITIRKVVGVGILLLVGGLWIGVGRSVAADAPKPLTPIPEQSPASGEPGASAAEEESSPAECDDGAEFCGLQVCSPGGRVWFRADYLMWETNGMRLPPLVTSSPQGTARADAGVLGLSTTTILYGNETINNDFRSGYRTTVGMWLDACHKWDIEFDYLSLGERSNNFSVVSPYGDPIIARPFFNTQTNLQASKLVAFPGFIKGSITADAGESFQSAGVLASYNLCSSASCGNVCDSCDSGEDSCEDSCGDSCGPPPLCCCRTDLLFGFRYYNLNDHITIREQECTTFDIHDNFAARNDFYGSELGLRSQIHRGRWSLGVLAKVAVGNTHETVTINGQTVVTAAGQPTETYNAGILAGYSNSGTYQRDVFTMIPQLGLELGYQVSRHWRTYVGYDLIYWGCVARAADQIDLNLDPRNFPPAVPDGLPFPAFSGRTDSFWAQGVNVGAELRF